MHVAAVLVGRGIVATLYHLLRSQALQLVQQVLVVEALEKQILVLAEAREPLEIQQFHQLRLPVVYLNILEILAELVAHPEEVLEDIHEVLIHLAHLQLNFPYLIAAQPQQPLVRVGVVVGAVWKFVRLTRN